MEDLLKNLEPKLLWKHFLALTAIPHGSKNEAAAAAYVAAQGQAMGLPTRQDAAGNVVITKPATDPAKKKTRATVLQGHLDMVCEKNEGTAHDFAADPLDVYRDGDFVKARGTTLGADNGIGVAAALAVLESTGLKHGPLECLFTIDEETGLTGAFQLDPSMLQGATLLNLDSEEEGALYIGCAGGMDSVATCGVRMVRPLAGTASCRVKVAGLKGGHSGLEISAGRGNALKILARVLWQMGDTFSLDIASFKGGSKRNAIPREAFAVVAVDPAKIGEIREFLAKEQEAIRSELGKADPDLVLSLEEQGGAPDRVMDPDDAGRVVEFLYACPHGVIAMSPDIPDLVQTSTNCAIIETEDERVRVSMSHRSSVESAKHDVGRMVNAYCTLAGFEVEQGSGYPGWKPNLDSPVLAKAVSVHERIFQYKPEVKAIHAGLECGIIGEKFPGMDMISFGPDIKGAHSPDERVSVKSVGNFWQFLVALLQEL